MTTTTPEPTATTDHDILTSQLALGRRVRDVGATVLMVASFVVAAVPLALIIYFLIREGAGIISWDFLTGDIIINLFNPDPGGIGPAVVGTLLTTGLAAGMAIPLGVAGAIYLNEFGKSNALARFVRLMSDVMTGVPSIVMGLFVATIWTNRFGFSAFGGALALGCLMLPIVIRSTEEMLRLVGDELRQGSYALGARDFRTVMSVVLPAALPGITSGAMLAVARAAGETAPVLFTIGLTAKVNTDPFSGSNTSLSKLIFKNATEAVDKLHEVAWGAALTLVVLVFVLTLVARLISARFSIEGSSG